MNYPAKVRSVGLGATSANSLATWPRSARESWRKKISCLTRGILVETYLVEGLIAESLLEHILGPLFIGLGYSRVYCSEEERADLISKPSPHRSTKNQGLSKYLKCLYVRTLTWVLLAIAMGCEASKSLELTELK